MDTATPQHPSPTVVLHIDMDAFYASVEQRDNPLWAGKPLVVGALPGSRGVLSAASYEARAYGLRSAMPVSEAYRRCPHAIYVRPNMRTYVRESHAVMAILSRFSPALEQISVDEAFLDITGTERLLGTPRTVADSIADAIRDERNLTASIGIAPNKFLAKVASDLDKPDGITEVPFEPDAIAEWLAPLPVSRIWGVGRKTESVLQRLGVRTIGDLQALSRDDLSRRFGRSGEALFDLCRGIDSREVVAQPEAAKSISREHTFAEDTGDRDRWERVLLTLAQDVARRARKADQSGRTVVLIYRMSDFTRHTRRATLPAPTVVATQIYDTAAALLEHIPSGSRLRLIGVGLTGFGEHPQVDLFGDERYSGWQASEQAIDAIEERFGRRTVVRGRELGGEKKDRPRSR